MLQNIFIGRKAQLHLLDDFLKKATGGRPLYLQGQIWFEYGEIDRALDEFDASVRLVVQANAPIHTKWYSANLCWMNSEHDLAKAAFEQSRFTAEAIGSRRLLWQILSAMAEIEPDPEKSVLLKTQARDHLQFIADHLKSDELRSLFLQSEAVKTIMA